LLDIADNYSRMMIPDGWDAH